MQCPKCKTELRIAETYFEAGEYGIEAIQTLVCSNPICSYRKANAPIARTRVTLIGTSEDDGSKFCCDRLLVKITDDGWFRGEGVETSILGDRIVARCPICKKVESFVIKNETFLG